MSVLIDVKDEYNLIPFDRSIWLDIFWCYQKECPLLKYIIINTVTKKFYVTGQETTWTEDQLMATGFKYKKFIRLEIREIMKKYEHVNEQIEVRYE